MRASELAGILPLSRVTSADEGGGKALALAHLARHGIPVPDTLVLPPDAAGFPAERLLDALGGDVAVRSSATAEDLTDASFAGQFSTVLGVRTTPELIRAVEACRASLRSPTVASYCAARGLDPGAIRMAVMIQRMVRAEIAGVLFTIHPMSGREDELLIETCPGIGADLVAGRATGARLLVRGEALPDRTEPLSPAQVRLLVDLGRRIQELQGAPQDVEWAAEGGRLVILQARPITRIAFAGIDGEWTTADFRDGGVASTVVAPLTWSLYAAVWDEALKGFLRDLRLLDGDFEAARVFYGRPYWNLGAVKRCAAKLPGYVEREFDRDLGVQPAYAGDGDRTPRRPWNFLRALPVLLAAGPLLQSQQAQAREVLRAEPWTRFSRDPSSLQDAELLRQFGDLVDRAYGMVESTYFRTVFCVALAKIPLRAAIEGLPVSSGHLVAGLDGLAHVECFQALWELANDGAVTLDGFLERYGHHSRRELDLRVPRWSDDASYVTELAAKFAGAEDPAEAGRRQRRHADEACERAMRLLGPWQRRRFAKRLARLRTYLWLREQMRDASLRLYAVIRRFALEIGARAAAAGHLQSADDVFYLTVAELRTALDTRLEATAARRRRHERMYRSFKAPNELGRGVAPPAAPDGRTRHCGVGASPGVVSGRVCVVRSLEEVDRLSQGDVLVCPFSDPGWTPLLWMAGAVVTEAGGLLSHAAVLCREFGRPAVLGVEDATRWLRNGQRVRVDGDHGHVDLLD